MSRVRGASNTRNIALRSGGEVRPAPAPPVVNILDTAARPDRRVKLEHSKAEATRSLLAGNPGREALLCAPDEISQDEFDLLVPTWIRLLRLRAGF
jgi:hypothetical protein